MTLCVVAQARSVLCAGQNKNQRHGYYKMNSFELLILKVSHRLNFIYFLFFSFHF